MTNVGLDPRKRNVATMSDSKGTTLKYTARQRNFESKLTRYRGILAKEKEVRGMLPFEVELSNHSSKTARSGIPGCEKEVQRKLQVQRVLRKRRLAQLEVQDLVGKEEQRRQVSGQSRRHIQ